MFNLRQPQSVVLQLKLFKAGDLPVNKSRRSTCSLPLSINFLV